MIDHLLAALSREEGHTQEYFLPMVIAVVVIFVGYQMANKWLSTTLIIELVICFAGATGVTAFLHLAFARRVRRQRAVASKMG